MQKKIEKTEPKKHKNKVFMATGGFAWIVELSEPYIIKPEHRIKRKGGK